VSSFALLLVLLPEEEEEEDIGVGMNRASMGAEDEVVDAAVVGVAAVVVVAAVGAAVVDDIEEGVVVDAAEGGGGDESRELVAAAVELMIESNSVALGLSAVGCFLLIARRLVIFGCFERDARGHDDANNNRREIVVYECMNNCYLVMSEPWRMALSTICFTF